MKYYYGLLLLFFMFLGSCGPSVKLTASWSDPKTAPRHVSKILVLSIGKDLQKRKMAEDNIKAELQNKGFNAATSLDEFGPDLAKTYDSAATRQILLGRQFDASITVRVLNVHESERWVPGTVYYSPVGFYRGFYGYYYRVFGYYAEPAYTVTDVEVLLESNLYDLSTGDLLWSGQSRAFDRNPTPAMASRYAKNIIEDILKKGVIIP